MRWLCRNNAVKSWRCMLLLLFILVLGLFGAWLATTGIQSRSSSKHVISDLNERIPKIFAKGNAPSLQVAVIHNRKLIWVKALGEEATLEQVYMNASMQKVFTSVALLRLAEQGRVDLDHEIVDYLPYEVRHPKFTDIPVTIRMLLVHRSGLGAFPYQFAWDTQNSFAPEYRFPCHESLKVLSLEEFIRESVTQDGINYNEDSWKIEPGKKYMYSLSAFPLLRQLIGEISQVGYDRYMIDSIFVPLGMVNSGFRLADFDGCHTTPYTRIDGVNVKLPIWESNGFMMRTNVTDLTRAMGALMTDGKSGHFRLLSPETIRQMRWNTSRFRHFLKSSEDMLRTGYGTGLYILSGGWYGYGGSAPGFQCLFRFNPRRGCGFVLLTNVNSILEGKLGENLTSARNEIYRPQEELLAILDPWYPVRSRSMEILFFALDLLFFTVAYTIMRILKRGKA